MAKMTPSSFLFPIVKIFDIDEKCQVHKEPEDESLKKCCYDDWSWYSFQFDGKYEVASIHCKSWDRGEVHDLEGCQCPFSQHDYWICGCFQSHSIVVFPG